MQTNNQDKIIQELLAVKLITPKQVQQAELFSRKTKKSLEEILLEERIVSQEDLLKIKSKIFKLPGIDLIDRKDITLDILNTIPREVAENYQMVAFAKEGNQVKIGLVDPQNFKAIEAAEFLAKENNWHNQYFLISRLSFQTALRQYQPIDEEIKKVLNIAQQRLKSNLQAVKKRQPKSDLERVIKRAPVSKIVDTIVDHAIANNASDIHIEPDVEETRVRYRIDGVLHTFLRLPTYVHSAIVSRIKVLANLKIDETRIPQDGRMRLTIDNQNFDFRVSTLPLDNKEKVALRILPSRIKIPTLQNLGFRVAAVEVIEKNVKRPHGLVLLTGPTGSGKTTTLYTVLNMLDLVGLNITTLEDPIEYYLSSVNQSQINPDVGLTFATGLRSILRQDPDVIMVGEIRDKETAELVMHASLTGHLVFSTLHTNDSFGAIPRLVDIGVQSFLISAALNLVIAQRLVRKLCPKCSQNSNLPPEVEKMIRDELAKVPANVLPPAIQNIIKSSQPFTVQEQKGCEHCNNTGYKGRLAIAELLEMDEKIKQAVIHGGGMEKLKQAAVAQKFISLQQDGLIKVLEGKTTLAEVLRVSQE